MSHCWKSHVAALISNALRLKARLRDVSILGSDCLLQFPIDNKRRQEPPMCICCKTTNSLELYQQVNRRNEMSTRQCRIYCICSKGCQVECYLISTRRSPWMSNMSRDMRCPIMWYVRPAMAQTSLRVGVSKLKRRLHRPV